MHQAESLPQDIQSQLNKARENLKKLGNVVSELVNLSPDVFEDEAIQTRLEDFRNAYQEATARLENPSFRIATIGTTSSGKSTVVNALMGRRIAPIEAGEMSGGVLTLKHSDERKLVIDSTSEAVWETGEWTNISDDELYSRIQTAMHSYHEARKKKDYIAPQISAHIPLLPTCDSSLSGLPEGINVEFLDLPGLKSVQDKTNLSILQALVGKSFSLVALDYMQVDEQHRQKLLSELKRVVEYLQGRTDSMIFILNRVDQRGSDDKPLEERLQLLRTEIQEQLNLAELPDIIPFNARLLYYAQCAWGTNPINTSSNISPEVRTALLKALFKDCANIIEEKTENDWDLEDWFTDIKKSVRRDGFIDDKEMRKLLNYSLQWSGGEKLWECMRLRLNESFSELVIAPSLMRLIDCYDGLSKLLDVIIQTKYISTIEEVRNKQAELENFCKKFFNLVKDVNEDFEQQLEEWKKLFKSKNNEKISQGIQEIEKKGYKGFQNMLDTVADIEGDLIQSIITPVRDGFVHKQSAFDLKDKLQEVIPIFLAENIAREYDHVKSRIINNKDDFQQENKYLVKKVKINNKTEILELEHDEKYMRLLYQTMKNALTHRAEFVLQTKEKDFVIALDSLIQEQIIRLKYCIPDKISESIDFEKAILADITKKLNQKLTKLPEKLFSFSTDIKQNSEERREKVGSKKVEKTREVGSCLKKRKETYTVSETKYGQVQYKRLYLPNINTMAEEWTGGIENSKYGKGGLWDILFDWIREQLVSLSVVYKDSLNTMINILKKTLNKQIIKLRNEEDLQLDKLSILKTNLENANDKYFELMATYKNPNININKKEINQDEIY